MRAQVLAGLLTAVCVTIATCGGDSPTEPAPVCSFAISPATAAFGADGGTATVTVTAASGCTWSSSASAAWIGVSAGASGTGTGTLSYTVAENSAAEPRNGTLTIAGQSHSVTQEGKPQTICTYELTPDHADFEARGGSGTFAIATTGACAWTATSNAAWLQVTEGAQGTGPGTVAFRLTGNGDLTARTAVISVADRSFTVRQGGDTPTLCDYTVAPVDLSACMPSSTLTTRVTTQASCEWRATPNVSWLTLVSGSSGSGSGVITIRLSDNYDAPRDGVVMVRWPTPTAGQNVRVAQAGCLYAVSRSAISIAAGGGSASFDVLQQSVPNSCGGATQDRCIWTAVSDVPWITITSSMPRSGDNPVAFTVAANVGAIARVGRITVRDKIVIVTQAGQ